MVGADEDGERQLRELAARAVDVSGVRRCAQAATGTAVILLTENGENSIVVASGANHRLTAADLDEDVLRSADVVVAQTELLPEVVDAAAAVCQRAGIRFVLNCAPVVALNEGTLAEADPLVVNEVEGAQLTTVAGTARDTASALKRVLGARSVVLTCGAHGVVVVDASGIETVPAVGVNAVDTTGAGDAFVGTLAAALAHDASLRDAVRTAVTAAAETVTHLGARSNGEQEA
jgi:ribokinase